MALANVMFNVFRCMTIMWFFPNRYFKTCLCGFSLNRSATVFMMTVKFSFAEYCASNLAELVILLSRKDYKYPHHEFIASFVILRCPKRKSDGPSCISYLLTV